MLHRRLLPPPMIEIPLVSYTIAQFCFESQLKGTGQIVLKRMVTMQPGDDGDDHAIQSLQ